MSTPTPRSHFPAGSSNVFVRVADQQAGLQHLSMVAMQLDEGKTFSITVQQYEFVMLILGGVCDIRTNRGNFHMIGRRPDVFTGLPHAIYLPPTTDFEIISLSDDFMMAAFWTPTTRELPLRLIRPDDVRMSFEGAGSGSVQINTVMTAGEGCQYLTVREIYVPGGNWYPHPPLMTEDTEILHLYKFDRPAGLAMQRLYGAEGRDDQTLTVRHDDVVAIASGSYSAAVAPGSAAYILSVTYGTPRSGAVDPAWKWWNDLPPGRDPRLPIVDRGMEP